MQVQFARLCGIVVAVGVGILCVEPGNVRAQSITPNFVQCALTAQGVLSCVTYNGASCSGNHGQQVYSTTCTLSPGAISATCTQSKLGTVSCTPVSNSACYTQNGTATCYAATPQGPPPLISTSPTTWQETQSVNSTTSRHAVTFTTANTNTNYTINGFAITGEFQITGTQGACTSGSANSYCQVYVTGTPTQLGPRYGTLSMVTSLGTVAVPLVVVGADMPVPTVDSKNAGWINSLSAVPPNPASIHVASVGSKASRKYAVGGQYAVGGPARPRPTTAIKVSSAKDEGDDTPCDPCNPGCSGDDSPCDDGSCDTCPDDTCDDTGGDGGDGDGQPTNLVLNSRDESVAHVATPEFDIGSHMVAFVGDPVNLSNGNKVQLQTDFSANYPNPLSFSRTYNSFAWLSAGLIGQKIGIGWRTNWDRSIVQSGPQQGYNTVTAVRDDGTSYVFDYQTTTQTWTGPTNVFAVLTQVQDGNGYGIGWKLTLPNGDIEQYDAIGRLTSVIPFAGPTSSYTLTYDGSSRLQTVSNGLGRQMSFAYNSNSEVATLTDSASGITTYSYDTLGHLTGVTYADGRQRDYAYANTTWPFAITAIIDGSGNDFVTFTYDSFGRMSSSQFAGGVGGGVASYGSNSASYTDAVGTVWEKIFQTNSGQLELMSDSVSCPTCPTQPTTLSYDGTGQLISFTNKNGIQATYQYNSRGLPTQIKEALNSPIQRTISTAWNATLPLRTQVTYFDHVVNYQYDSYGHVTQEKSTAGAVSRATQYAYNGQGLLSQMTDPLGNVTAYTYDSLGNLATLTNAKGQVTTYSNYNGLGQAQSVTYPNGTAASYTFDAIGRELTESNAGNTKTYTYDANGNKASMTMSDGSWTTYVYDTSERLTGVNNNLGEQIRYTLDATRYKKSHKTQTNTYDSTGALVATSSTLYDGMGRVEQQIDAQGHKTQYAYDANGNVTKTTDPLNNVVQMNYDALNRPTLFTDPLQHTIQINYDLADRPTQLTDPNGNSTNSTYSGFGDKSQAISPDAGVTSYTFDADSNRLTMKDARGDTTTYGYDQLNRLVQVTYANGQGITKTYDVAPNGVGQIASMTDLAGTTSFTYDANGLLLTKTLVSQGVTLPLTYGRDSLERITSITYPSGNQLGLTYTNNLVTSMTWNGATVIGDVQYFPFGAPESWLIGGTTEYTRYTDQNNRIYKYLTPAGSRTLSYDLDGRVTQITDAPSALTQSFTYDATSKLLTFAGFTSASSSEARSYSYDSNGNRLTAVVNGASSTYSYIPGTNKLQSVSGLFTNTYDAAGNLISDGRLTYTFDSHGRAVQIVVPGSSGTMLTFQYNGNEERVTKWDSAANTGRMWIYDDAGHVLGEYTYPGGAAVQELMWLGSTPVAVAGTMPATYGVGYIWTDHQDTPRAITNSNGQVLWQWDSAPFGETPANANPSGLGNLTFNLRFPGQYLDVATGLHQNWNRDYNPVLGRFVEVDPMGFAAGTNPYQYTGSNPTGGTDSTGLFRVGPGSTITLPLPTNLAQCLSYCEVANYACQLGITIVSTGVCFVIPGVNLGTTMVVSVVTWAITIPICNFAQQVCATSCNSKFAGACSGSCTP